MSIVINEDGSSHDSADMLADNFTLAQAAEVLIDHLHICDVEAQEIANRISQPKGLPNRCPDGVQVLEDAEKIIRAALDYATA